MKGRETFPGPWPLLAENLLEQQHAPHPLEDTRFPARLQPEDILQALQASGGNRSEAARRLGISRVTLYRRIHRLELVERLEDSKK